MAEQVFFHFGTENGEEQLKKPPCIFLIKKTALNKFKSEKSYSVLFFPLIFNMNMFCMSPSPINLYGLLSFYSILCWRYVLFDPQISLDTLGDIVIN